MFNIGCICCEKNFERYQNARYNNEKKLLKKFRRKRDEVIGEWRRLHDEEL